MERKLLNTKNVVLMGMFGALAAVLMLFEVPLPFLAPSFYGLDFAEVPMLVGTFALGPLSLIHICLLRGIRTVFWWIHSAEAVRSLLRQP